MPDEFQRLLEENSRAEAIQKAHIAAQPCTCDMTRRNILNVGKAVNLRNRLQMHYFPSPSRRPSWWTEQYESPPHEHLLFIAAWFVQKNELSVAECTLIEYLKPRHNQKERNGFGDSVRWPFRWPDLEGLSCFDIEPVKSRKPFKGRLENLRSGVYAWYYGHLRPLRPRPNGLLDLFLDGHEKEETHGC